MSRRRTLGFAVMAVAAWYGGVLFLFPRLLCGPVSAMNEIAGLGLREHYMAVCAGNETLGSLVAGSTLSRITAGPGSVGSLRIDRGSDGRVQRIILAPHKPWRYQQRSWVYRLLFLDFEKVRFKTYVLTSDGRFLANSSKNYCAAKMPTDSDLATLDVAHDETWSMSRNVANECRIARERAGPPVSEP